MKTLRVQVRFRQLAVATLIHDQNAKRRQTEPRLPSLQTKARQGNESIHGVFQGALH